MIEVDSCSYYSDNECMDKQEKFSVLREFFNSEKIIDHTNEPHLSYGKVVYRLNKKHKTNLAFMVYGK